VLGRRIGAKVDRGGLGGFGLAFRFSTLLLVFNPFVFPDGCLSKDFDVEGIGAVLAAEATLSLPGLPILAISGSPRASS
jgi:hypothetical protein